MSRSLALTVSLVVAVGTVGHAQEDTDSLITFRGMVIDTSLRPVADVLVYLSSARIFSLSDEAGTFTLAEVEPGLDTLQVRGRGFMPRTFRLVVPDSVRGTIDIGDVKLVPGPPPTLTLNATVYDTLQDRPVDGAQVMVNDEVVGETDTTGVFVASEIPIEWGLNVILVRRVGYSPLFRTFWVDELDARRSFNGVMQQRAVDLPAVVVEADRIIFSYGRMREFWLRRERGLGRFFTRDDIERRNPIFVSDLLRTIPGLRVVQVAGGTRIRSSRSARRCEPGVWIDGVPLSDWDLDELVQPEDVEAMEVYSGSAETPVRFGGPFTSCGAIVIWTR